MKRILSIQDISCIGKCSLTVALPIISAAGIECSIVPTAVLSTHTMFKGFTFRDLTDDLLPIRDHWVKEGFSFDAIYTGYLGSIHQIELVRSFFDTFRSEGTRIIVDPAMADSGKLYVGFDNTFANEMARLCGSADVILPNISEAAILQNAEYPGEDADPEEIRRLLEGLLPLGARTTIITGVTLSDNSFGYMGYDRDTDTFFEYGTTKIPMRSHGTGDIFASSFTGALVRTGDLQKALKIAATFTGAAIRNSYEDPEHVNYSVNFEEELGTYMQLLQAAE